MLIFCISLGAVSAADSADMSVNDINDVATVESSINVNDEINEVNEGETGSFADLNKTISESSDDTIYLEHDYKFVEDTDSDFKNGIKITKAITIDGQGFTIDGSNLSRAFYITVNNVTLKNITFINCSFTRYGCAIYSYGDSVNVESCSFVNCSSAIYLYRIGSISDCSFVNCSAVDDGGAIYSSTVYFTVDGCSFVSCNGKYSGAIYVSSGSFSVDGCSFVNCSAVDDDGGAICSDNGFVKVDGCSFMNCSAVDDGGAIYSHKNSLCEISDCDFVNCSAVDDGGAIYSDDYLCEIISCSFVNCSAADGGAIYWDGTKGVVNYNIFDNNQGYAIKGKAVDCDFNFFAFENNITSFPDGLVSGSTVNNWVVLNISRDDANYSVDFVCNDGSALTKSMPVYTANLNINDYFQVIAIENNTFKDTIVFGDYLLTSNNSGNVLAKTNFSKKTTDYNITTYGVYGENATVTVKVNDSATGTITVKVDDGQVFTGIIDNGVVNIILSNLSTGVHNLIISYSGDDDYLQFNTTANLTVSKNANYNMSISTKNVTSVEDEVIEITLPFDANGFVVVNVNGNDYHAEVKDGLSTLTIKNLKIGNYSIIAYYGDSNYELKNITSNFIVTGLNPNLTVDSVSTTKGNSIDLIAHLDSNATGFVIFYVNDTKVGISEIEKGIANYTYIPKNVGNFTIKAVYIGDDKYSSSEAEGNLTVKGISKLGTILSASTLTISAYASKNLVVTLKDSKGKVLSGKKVTIAFNSKTYNVITDANGQAKLSITNKVVKNYTATIKFTGDTAYTGSFKSVKVVIKPAYVTVADIIKSAKTLKSYSSKNKKLPATIKVGSYKLTHAQLTYLMTVAIKHIKAGKKTSTKVKVINVKYTTYNAKISKKIMKNGYLSVVNTLYSKGVKGTLPKYFTYGGKKTGYNPYAYSLAKILAFYSSKKRLPTYCVFVNY